MPTNQGRNMKIRTIGHSGLAAACSLGLALLRPASARAETFCGYLEADTWNVAEGGMVWNQNRGMVTPVMNAVGEKRTHVVISNGVKDGGSVWVTHATMFKPGING